MGSNWARKAARRLDSAIAAASLASGVAMIVAPDTLDRVYGLRLPRRQLRMLGVRDALVGAALLRWRRSAAPMLARAVADAMDARVLARQRESVGADERIVYDARLAVAIGLAAVAPLLALARGNKFADLPHRRC